MPADLPAYGRRWPSGIFCRTGFLRPDDEMFLLRRFEGYGILAADGENCHKMFLMLTDWVSASTLSCVVSRVS